MRCRRLQVEVKVEEVRSLLNLNHNLNLALLEVDIDIDTAVISRGGGGLFTVLVLFYIEHRVYNKSPVLQIYFEGDLILHGLSGGAWEPTHIDPCVACSFLGDHVEVND